MGESYTKITPQIGSRSGPAVLIADAVAALAVGDEVVVTLGEVVAEDECEHAALRGHVWMSGGTYLVGPIAVRYEDGTPDRLVRDVRVVRPAWHDAAVISATVVTRGDADVKCYLLRGETEDGEPQFVRVRGKAGEPLTTVWHGTDELFDVEVIR